MLCDKCKKNQATVYFEQVTNGAKHELNLCYKCSLDLQTPMFFNNILNGILLNIKTANTSDVSDLKCKTCSLTYSEFRKRGKLGCSNCYTSFRKELSTIFKNIQFNSEHKGKFPKKSGAAILQRKEIENTKIFLKQAIDNEEYEEAAALRDKIKAMEKKMRGV